MKRPLIALNTDVTEDDKGISCSHYIRYARAVWDAGGRPVLVPPLVDADPAALLDGMGGLILVGGDDLDPALYGGGARHPVEVPLHPLREAFDMALLRAAVRLELPTLAVCLGMQELCVAHGGKLHSFIPDTVPGALAHRTPEGGIVVHPIDIEAGSLLGGLLGCRAEVNSAHRQAVSDPGRSIRVTARTADGIIEAVEGTDHPFLLGVQWHPDLMHHEPAQAGIFEALVRRAGRR